MKLNFKNKDRFLFFFNEIKEFHFCSFSKNYMTRDGRWMSKKERRQLIYRLTTTHY